jgi:hypothetical protein
VAKLDHTFSIPLPLQQAKEQFQMDIGPGLRREGSFRVAQDESRRLMYSDGVVPLEPAPLGRSPGDWNTYARLRRLLARRIEVEFAPEAAGTRVTLRGKAERDICAALGKLGGVGQWPENRERLRELHEAERDD